MLDNVYRSKPRFLQHLQTQAANIDQFNAEVGLSGDQVKALKNDAATAQWFQDTTELVVTFKEAVVGASNRFFSAKLEPAIGEFVAAPPVAPPLPPIAGAIKRSRDRDQLMLAHKPSQNALEGLDLLGGGEDKPSADTIKPIIEAFAAATGYHFAAVISNRGDSAMSDIYISRVGTTKWTKTESGTGKSVNVTVEPTPEEAGKPIQLQTRVQLRKNNTDYGVISEPVFVTVNP